MTEPEPKRTKPCARVISERESAAAHWQSAIAKIMDNPELCDVVFVVQGERLHALRLLCCVHSEIFENVFGEGWRETVRGDDVDVGSVVQLGGPPVGAAAFRIILEWCHSGRASLDTSCVLQSMQVCAMTLLLRLRCVSARSRNTQLADTLDRRGPVITIRAGVGFT